MNIRDIIVLTAKVCDLKLTDEQIQIVVEMLGDKIKPEIKSNLRFQGCYIRSCPEHKIVKVKIEEQDGQYKWLCSICGKEMILIPKPKNKEVKKVKVKNYNNSKKLDYAKLYSDIQSGIVDLKSLSAGQKAALTKYTKNLRGG